MNGGSLQDLGQTSYHLGQIAGQLAVAYSQVERSGVEIDSLVARIGHLATGLISPSTVAERLGWVLGTRDGSLARTIAKRIERAREQLGTSIDRSEGRRSPSCVVELGSQVDCESKTPHDNVESIVFDS